jgi:hypothetical protein
MIKSFVYYMFIVSNSTKVSAGLAQWIAIAIYSGMTLFECRIPDRFAQQVIIAVTL